MHQSNFFRRSNIFDDDRIPPEKLQEYRNAKPLSITKRPPVHKFLEKPQENPHPLTSSSVSTSFPPQTQYQSTATLNTQSLVQPFGHIMDTIPYTEESAVNVRNIQTEEKEKCTAGPNPRKMVSFNKMKSIPEEDSSSMMESSANMLAKLREKVNKVEEEPLLLSSADIYERVPIDLSSVDMSTSVAFQLNSQDSSKIILMDSRQAGKVHVQEIEPGRIGLTEQNTEGEKRSPGENYDNKEEVHDTGRIENQVKDVPVEETRGNREAFDQNPIISVEETTDNRQVFDQNPVIPVEEKVQMEDKSLDTEGLMIEEEVKQEKEAPVLKDQMVDTTGLVVYEDKEEEQKAVMEDKMIDTYQLIINKDMLTDTDELLDDERRRTVEEIKALKLSFLTQLFGFKEKVETMKKEQAETKQVVSGSIEETIEKLTTMVRTSLDEYMTEKTKQQKENLLTYQLELASLKDELQKVRAFVVFTIDKIKGMLENYIQGEAKNQLEKMIDESTRERIFQLGMSRLNDLLSDAHSVSSESTHATPQKVTPTEKDSTNKRPRRKPGSSTKKHSKMDKAVVEGMLYLLDHEALKNPFRNGNDYREKLERILKSPATDQLTSDLVLNSLMEERTRKKHIDFSDVEGKRRRRKNKNTRGEEEEEDDDETLSQKTFGETGSVRSERTHFLTPGKDSYKKKERKSSSKFATYADQNGKKVFVVEEDNDLE